MQRFSLQGFRPELIYRLLGYGGLTVVAVIQLRAGAGVPAAGLLAIALIWPALWHRFSPAVPALIASQAKGALFAHAAECLVVLWLVRASGAADWLLPAVALSGLAGVTALGGLRMLLGCASAFAVFFLLPHLWWAGPGSLAGLDGSSAAGGLLVAACCLGLAWLAHVQAKRLNAGRRQAVRESSELKGHNDRLARYLPEELVPVTRAQPGVLQPPREVFVTVAFIDLVGFAQLVAGHGVAEVVDVLNDFMAAVSRLTARSGGVLGKFLGDGVLVYFPEPVEGSGTEACAPRVRAAAGCAGLARMLEPELLALAGTWRQRGLRLRLASRIGIASGYCALGDWGGRDRLDYTLIGTPVNLASRLQALASTGAPLLCSASAALIAQDSELAGCLGPARTMEVRGMGPVVVHELSGSAKVRAILLPVRSGRPDA